ncbi:MAG: rhomboid family intramembrane serine protease [Anaerolineae bacterium]|nr:rhomboid family intramembrane serine protease [Anaerolineae bacterium]
MIPLGDNTPRRHVPTVTYLLIGLNVLVFLVELVQGPRLQHFIYQWGAVPARLARWPQHPIVLITLVTSMFLHGGWWHLIGNMVYLWIFGDNVEDQLGSIRYLLFYLFGGIAAGVLQALLSAGSNVPGIGASGAVAAVLGAYLVFFPAAQVLVGIPLFFWFEVFAIPAVLVLGFWFVSQFFNGLLTLAVGRAAFTGGVAWWAHVGGFLFGMIIGPAIRPRWRRRPPWSPYIYYYR